MVEGGAEGTVNRAIIGIDIGWSVTRASCGVAVVNSNLSVPKDIRYPGNLRCARMTLADLLDLGSRWRREPRGLGSPIIVIDGPLGRSGPPTRNRRIDAACASGGFKGRCQPMPIEHPSSAEFIRATYDVLHSLGAADKTWIGGELSVDDTVVIETNPTVALAVSVEMQRVCNLPSRRRARPLKVDGVERLIRAKSDWYWEIGGDTAVWKSLNIRDVPSEHDHERVAALTCAAIGSEFASGSGVAVGDECGVYGLLRNIDTSWASDLSAIGLVGATPSYGHFPALEGIDEQVPVMAVPSAQYTSASCGPSEDVDWRRGDCVDLLLCDSGGINEAQNGWLAGCKSPIELELDLPACSIRRITLSHGLGRQRNPDQWVISPTSTQIRDAIRCASVVEGHDFSLPLSLDNVVVIPVRIIGSG